MISAARSSSPRPSPQPSGPRRTGPCMGSDYDWTRVLEVIPNTTDRRSYGGMHSAAGSHFLRAPGPAAVGTPLGPLWSGAGHSPRLRVAIVRAVCRTTRHCSILLWPPVATALRALGLPRIAHGPARAYRPQAPRAAARRWIVGSNHARGAEAMRRLPCPDCRGGGRPAGRSGGYIGPRRERTAPTTGPGSKPRWSWAFSRMPRQRSDSDSRVGQPVAKHCRR